MFPPFDNYTNLLQMTDEIFSFAVNLRTKNEKNIFEYVNKYLYVTSVENVIH